MTILHYPLIERISTISSLRLFSHRAMGQARRPPKRFAPLDPEKGKGEGSELRRLEGVVFDVDGTLW